MDNTRSSNPTGGVSDQQTVLRQTLERYFDCPTAETAGEIATLLSAYQNRWIAERAGSGATTSIATTKPAAETGKRLPRVSHDEQVVLKKLAEGWPATTADVPRWSWFENRELVALAPHPDGGDAEILVITPLGQAVAKAAG